MYARVRRVMNEQERERERGSRREEGQTKKREKKRGRRRKEAPVVHAPRVDERF